MDDNELNAILDKHKKWLGHEEGGERTDLRGSNLRGADLSCSDLSYSNLSYSDLGYSDLCGSDLSSSNLRGSDLSYSNLCHSNLRGADLSRSDLCYSTLRGADLSYSDLREADIDFSAWPLWCGSLKAYVDDRIAILLLYHTLSVVQHSPYVSDELKRALLTPGNIDAANHFHRVEECGELEVYDNGNTI